MALKRMSIKVSEELYNYISAEAEREGLSMNAVIIFAPSLVLYLGFSKLTRVKF